MILFYFVEITLVYEGCDVNDALLTRYCAISVETAKCLYKESQPKNKNKLNFLWVNHSGSWDLSLNSTKEPPSITLPSSLVSINNKLTKAKRSKVREHITYKNIIEILKIMEMP